MLEKKLKLGRIMDMETIFENLLQTRSILYGEIIIGILKELESIDEEIRFFHNQLFEKGTTFRKSTKLIDQEHVKWMYHELEKYTNRREKALTVLDQYKQRFYKHH